MKKMNLIKVILSVYFFIDLAYSADQINLLHNFAALSWKANPVTLEGHTVSLEQHLVREFNGTVSVRSP